MSLTNIDMARYRVIYAAVMLLALPSYTFLSTYPDALYRPPPGPFRLLNGFPPEPILAGVGVLLAVALACLLAGRFVTAASWVATLTMLTGSGLSYSLGKIDHNLLVVLTPIVLLAAGWAPGAVTRPWVLRLWAFTIGASMLTAGLSKLLGGWLNPHTHAVQGYTFGQVYAYGLTGWLGSAITHITSPWFWEPMDWAAVALECSLVVLAMVGLRTFRAGLAALALFHLAVMLMMGITFSSNVLTYAAFVSWGAFAWSTRTVRVPMWVVLAAGVAWWSLNEHFGKVPWIGQGIVFTGAGVGLWYLLHSAQEVRRGHRGRDTQRSSDEVVEGVELDVVARR